MSRFTLAALLACLTACSNGNDDATLKHTRELGESPAVSDATWTGKSTMTCIAISKTICTFSKCVTSQDVRTIQRINPATATYKRCDRHAGGCDTLRPQVAHSGIWTTLADPVHTATLRVTARGDFVEYLAQNDDVYIYRGRCRPVAWRR